MNRLGIYFFYDKDGIVDNYVSYFLSALKQFCSELCVVVNGKLNDDGYKKLNDCSDRVLLRENIGFDSWAYKHALNHYGFDKIKEYDELIMCNFTFFGPIFPLSEMFEKMEKSKCDFWGCHKHPEITAYIANTKIVEHIQSHFIVCRQELIQDKSFKKYWDSLKDVNSYEEAIAFHELRFTPYFENKGFISDCYMNKEKYFKLLNSNASVSLAGKQLVEDRSPLLKRKVFAAKDGMFEFEQVDKAKIENILNFIDKHTQYPVSFIAQNITRSWNISIDDKSFAYRLSLFLKSVLSPSKRKRRKCRMLLHSRNGFARILYFAKQCSGKETQV